MGGDMAFVLGTAIGELIAIEHAMRNIGIRNPFLEDSLISWTSENDV